MLPFKFKTFLTAVMILGAQMAFASANSAPTITSEAVTSVDEDSVYTYAMSANDANNDDLNWSVVDKPHWLILSSEGSSSVSTFADGFSATPKGIGVDEATGNIYIASDDKKIYKVTPSGEKEVFASIASSNYGNMIVYNGELYVPLNTSSGDIIVKYDISDTSGDATATTVATSSTNVKYAFGMALKDGFLYVALRSPYKVIKLDLSDDLPITPTDVITETDNALVNNLFGLVIDDAGNIYMSTWSNQTIVKYDGTNVTTFIDDTGSNATDIKIDNQGNFYVSTAGGGVKKYSADFENNTTISDGLSSWGMTITNAGTLLMGDNSNNTDYSNYRVVKLETGATLTGTPTNDDVGVHDVNLTVSDGTVTVPHNFQITVNNVNDAPTITGGDTSFSVDEDTEYTLDLNVTDVDSSDISWVIKTQGSNGTASVDGNGTSNTISYIPSEDFSGTDSFVVEVSDGNLTNEITVDVTVNPTNDAPTITSNPSETIAQGEKYTYEVIATDQEDDPVSFDVNTDASWLSLGSDGFDFTKVAGGNGSYYWNNSVDNGDGGLATDAKLYGYGDIVKKDNGDIYFTQNYSIRKINASDGKVNTVAGSGNTNYYTYNSDYEIVDGTATDVNLTSAHVMSINPDDGEIYFAECGVIRKFDEDTNTITTVVGKNSQGCGYYYGGSSSYEDRYKLDANNWQESNLRSVSDLKFDNAGNMYVKDSYSLVKFAKDGTVSTITKRDYDHSYSSNDRVYFEGSKAASEVSRHELQINYFDVTDSGVIYFIGYTYKKYDTSWGTSYYSIPILGKIEDGNITKIKDLDNVEKMQNNEYYNNTIWFNGLEVGEDGNIYTMSNEYEYDDSSSYYHYGTQKSHLVKFSSDGTELSKIEIKNDSGYVSISNFTMSDDYDFYYFDNSYDASNPGGKLMKIAQKSVSLSGTPTCKDIGSYSVDVNATDIHGATSTQSFTLEVTNVNDAPEFDDASAVVTEGSSIGTLVTTLKAQDCDEADIFTYSIVSGNEDGDFSLDTTTGELSVAKTISILEKQSYLLEINATDKSGAYNTGYLTIAVADADLVPQASNDEVTTNEENNTTINVLENDSDGDNNIDVLGLTITKQPSNGKATTQDNGTIVYVPNKDFFGEDVITYTVKDKTNLVSNEANATIVVNNINDKPIAVADVVQTPEDVDVIFLPIKNDTDADGASDIATINITTQPSNGDINVTNGEATYSPELNFYGTDSFEYTITDGNGTTSEAVKSYITVAEVNDIPVAYDDTMETDEDTNVTFAILDNDWDDHSILDSADSIEIIKSPENGKVVKEVNGTITYEPNKNFFGNDSFEYAAYDNNGTMSLPATVQVTINPVNDAPVAVDDNYTIAEDTIATFNIINNDQDVEDNITNEISIETQPENGKVKVLSSGKVLYVPTSNYNGTDTFTYNIKDAQGAVSKNNATVNITITPVDDIPVLESITDLNTTEDFNDLNITLSSSDVDGDDINYTVKSSDESIATVSIVNGKVVVTPVENASGVITIEVIASANDKNATQSFDIEVAEVNDTPTFTTTLSDTSIDEDNGTISYELNVSDIEADDLNITVDSNDTSILTVSKSWDKILSHADYSNQSLDFNLTTQSNKNGQVAITVIVNDGELESKEVYTVEVSPVNDAPTLADLSDQIVYKNFDDINITLEVEDVDADTLEYNVTSDDLSIFDLNITNSILNIKSIEGQSGNSDINITVSDKEFSVSKVFNLRVLSFEDGDNVEEKGEVSQDTDENGTKTTTVTVPDDNLKVETKEDQNGTVTHEIDLGDKKVVAKSDVNGSVVNIIEDGVQTVFENVNTNVKAEVNATVTGEASHVLTKDGKTTKAVSKFVGANTKIKDVNGEVEIETEVSIDTNTTVKVIAKQDGSAEHTVKKGSLESKAVSTVPGANTIIDESGNVDTSVPTTKLVENGKVFEAVAITDSEGNTVTKFRLLNKATNTEEESSKTLSDTTKFPIGSSVEIDEDTDGKTHIQTTTPVLDDDTSFKVE